MLYSGGIWYVCFFQDVSSTYVGSPRLICRTQWVFLAGPQLTGCERGITAKYDSQLYQNSLTVAISSRSSLQLPSAFLSPLSETLDGECATVVRSIYLKVGYSHSCNHSKHNEEHPSDDRLWNGNENCSKFSKDSQNEHENSGHLEDQSAAHLSKISRRTHPIQIYFISCFHFESYD